MNNFILAAFLVCSTSVIAEGRSFSLRPAFNGASKAEFAPVDDGGTEVLKGSFIGSGEQRFSIPDVCEPEGGNADLSDAYVVKGKETYFVFTCAWAIQHFGLGLHGTQYETFVYTGVDLISVAKKLELSQALSGYEGTLEDGTHSYAWYSQRKIAGEKLLELELGKSVDSLGLAHDIVLARLNNGDYDAIKYYLSAERVHQLILDAPVSKFTAVAYNDFGYALWRSGENDRAYEVLKKVENVLPNRVILALNIADVLWVSEPKKSKEYYKKYIVLMRKAGKEKLISARAYERGGSD